MATDSDQYDGTSCSQRYPADGTCEFQTYGPLAGIDSFVSFFFALMAAGVGTFGLSTSTMVTVGSKGIYGLLVGYGIMSTGHMVTTWKCFADTSGIILNLLQAAIFIRLTNTLKFRPFNRIQGYWFFNVMVAVSSTYPVLAHTLGQCTSNQWVGWLTYDSIWLPILIVCLCIFFSRKKYTEAYKTCPDIFRLIWVAAACCILGYTFWLMDKFWCKHVSKWPASRAFYGMWLFFTTLTFYYFTVLDVYLSGKWDVTDIPTRRRLKDVVVSRWPSKFIILYVRVFWTPTTAVHQASTAVFGSDNFKQD